MTFVVTLEEFAPPARADAVFFTKARIEEAAAEAGPWTTIATLNVNTGTDPEHPEEVDLTTTAATLEAGWYRVVWIDSNGKESTPTAAVQNEGDLAGGMRPTVERVAALLRARTKIVGGGEAGTFNASTRPTAEQVDDLITEAEDEVLGKVQPPSGLAEPEQAKYERRVRGAIRLYTAMLVEMSYFPEQIRSGQSSLATLEKLYDSRIKALIAEGETGEVQGEGGGPGGDSPADAAWTFPSAGRGLIGWNTRW